MKLFKVVEQKTNKIIFYAENKVEAKVFRDAHNEMVKAKTKKNLAFVSRGPDHWKGEVFHG